MFKILNYDPGAIKAIKTLKLPEAAITYSDFYHLKNLYKYLKEFLSEYGYLGGDGEKEMEILYSEQIRPSGTEYHIWWRVKKDINKFVRYTVDINYLGLAIGNTEIIKDDKKVKMQKGEINIFIKPKILLDYEDKWENHKYLKYVLEKYIKLIYKKEIEMHKRELVMEMLDLQNYIKQYLEIKGIPKIADFHPSKGFD